MDSPTQFAFYPRVVGRNGSQQQRRPSSESYHSSRHSHSSVNSPLLYMPEPNLSYPPPPLPPSSPMRQPPEQSSNDPLSRFRSRDQSRSSSNTHEIAPPKLRNQSILPFEYHRYPSPPPPPPAPPPIEGGIPTRYPNPPQSFTYPAPAPQPTRVQTSHHHQRTASSPSQHPSPVLNRSLHRTHDSSPSTGNSTTLPPLSNAPHRPPMLRGVDQPPNHHHVDNIPSPAVQMRPSTAQLSRDRTEHQQGQIRRHTVDSGQVLHQQMGSSTGGRQRTPPLPGYPAQHLHTAPGTQQAPPQPGQTNPNSNSYPIPPPLQTSRRYDPPASAISPTSPPPQPPLMSNPQQPPPLQSPESPSQPGATDETPPIPDTETVDIAFEPLRLGFENVLTQTVQNVHQVLNRLHKDTTRQISAERRKNAYLMRCLVNSSEKLKGQEWAAEELKKENESLKEKAVENGRLKRENTQNLAMMDTLNQENHFLKRENNELRKKNEEVKDALTRAAGFVFQYKEELDKVRADIDHLRKSREASSLSPQTPTAPSSDHQREMSRLHAERERERIFNDAVKQLRALTALEDSARSNFQNPETTRERRDSEEAPFVDTTRTSSDVIDRGDRDRRTRSSLPEISTFKQILSSPSVAAENHDTIPERRRPSTPPPPPSTTKVASTDKEGEECRGEEADSREIVDVDMSDEDVTVVPPITSKRVTSPPPSPSPNSVAAEHLENASEQRTQPTDESRAGSKPPLLELETQRQRRRQARRGPTSSSSSSPRTRSKKASTTGMKRSRDEYEDDQEEANDATSEEPGEVEEDPTQIVHSPSPVAERGTAIHVDVENFEEADEVILDAEQQDVDININISKDKKTRRKGRHISTEVTPPTDIQSSNKSSSAVHPKALGRWSYYTHFRDNSGGATAVTQPSTSLPPSPPERPSKRHPKLGINHMDLLYKTEKEIMICRICLSLEQNPDSTAAERRKAKANTKKFPLNASWADLINHCQTEHTKACEDMEKLSPSQVAEMKQRMPVPSATATSTR